MKALAAAILTFLVMLQSFSQWLIMAEYALNKNFIAKNLCINKARPQLRCHGKCQMMKKLAEEEKENGTDHSGLVSKLKLPEVFFSDLHSVLLSPGATPVAEYNGYNRIHLYSAPQSSVFRPPSA